MRQYRIKEERGRSSYPFIPQYSDDKITWNSFSLMGTQSYETMEDAVERIEEDIEEQEKQKEYESKTIYHPYPPTIPWKK